MKIFKDQLLENQITDLQLGVVKAGEVATYEFYISNDSDAKLQELVFKIDHPEVQIIEACKEILPNSVGKLVIEWRPQVTLKEGLKTQVSVQGEELWG
jgi:hypothetical protein